MNLADLFRKLGGALAVALNFAKAHGLNDSLIEMATSYATEAAVKFVDNDERRKWVIGQLTTRGVPENLAMTALGLGLSALKAHAGK